MAAQLKDPREPVEAIEQALEGLGATIVVAGFPFGEYDVLVVYEAPDDMTTASVAMAVTSRGRGQVGQDHASCSGRAGSARVPARTLLGRLALLAVTAPAHRCTEGNVKVGPAI